MGKVLMRDEAAWLRKLERLRVFWVLLLGLAVAALAVNLVWQSSVKENAKQLPLTPNTDPPRPCALVDIDTVKTVLGKDVDSTTWRSSSGDQKYSDHVSCDFTVQNSSNELQVHAYLARTSTPSGATTGPHSEPCTDVQELNISQATGYICGVGHIAADHKVPYLEMSWSGGLFHALVSFQRQEDWVGTDYEGIRAVARSLQSNLTMETFLEK